MSNQSTGKEQTRKGRQLALLLTLAFLGPLALAMLLYFNVPGWKPSGSTNYGVLLQPPVTLPEAFTQETQMRGHWNLVLSYHGECQAQCRDALIQVRQVRLASGREADRIKRFVLLDQQPADPGFFQNQHPDLAVLSRDTAGGKVLSVHIGEQPSYYLVDPLGNIILQYPVVPVQKLLLNDLKKLLKLSRIG